MRFQKLLFVILFFIGFINPAIGDDRDGRKDKDKIYKPSEWADSVFAQMTVEEKIGQLFMVGAFTSGSKYNIKDIKKLIKKYNIGGVIFFKGGPIRTALAINRMQEVTKYPLMFSIDGEWGLSMRLDSTINYGYHISLGAHHNDSIGYYVGKQIARECKRLGLHINFGPVVDINNNPNNPVINVRSFGENKKEVAHHGLMYALGMQSENILAVAKHFPGHGNTSTDSHYDLPILTQSVKNMDTLELYPFKQLIKAGVGAIMNAHLNIPAYDTAKNMATSLSPLVSTLLLKWQLKYKGLTFTDALNMQGVAKYNAPGETEYKALLAGNDILLYPEDVPKAVELIKNALDSGCISMDFIDKKVLQILHLKKWLGLDNCTYVDTNNLVNDLNQGEVLKNYITKGSVTVLKNKKGIIPIRDGGKLRWACLTLGNKNTTPFQEHILNYGNVANFNINFSSNDEEYQTMQKNLESYSGVIVCLHSLSNRTGTFGITYKAYELINQLQKNKEVILVNFSTPYALSRFPNFESVVVAYQEDAGFQKATAEVIFGGIRSRGKTPVGISDDYPYKSGLVTMKPIRFETVIPSEVGLNNQTLSKIDSIAQSAIDAKATPGCQIWVSKNGKVVYQKSFGTISNESKIKVKNSFIYDVASLTKTASTTLCVMKLYETKQIVLDSSLSYYLPELIGTNKSDITLKEVLAHQAGLFPFIPPTQFLGNYNKPCNELFCSEPNNYFNIKVADSLFMDYRYRDSIHFIMDNSKIEGRGRYKYSDLGFMYLQRILEKITNKRLNELVDSLYFKPLSLYSTGYLPLNKISQSLIIPTERDSLFRNQLLRGFTHDPTAALLGGVSGHAGLFSNANDLGVILLMLLNKGEYAGIKFLKQETIQLFTSRPYPNNKRGLGWDKPELDPKKNGATSALASPSTFGHTGFTGTCFWADPDNNLAYVFLSNRVNLGSDNHKLVDMNIRTKIHDIIYQSFTKFKPSSKP